MKESFLHYIWKHKYFDQTSLSSVSGEPVVIISPGFTNDNEGPDFSQAEIKIGNKEWHGQVEIHISSSDWDVHGHTTNPLYQNVILHVVYNADKEIRYNEIELIPTIELRDRIPLHLFENHENLLSRIGWIPCTGLLSKHIDRLKWISWSERLLAERIREKAERIGELYQNSNGDWEESLYHWMAYGFGLKVNSNAFMRLAQALPLKIVNKNKADRQQLYALFYGQAGMLHERHIDEWPKQLSEQYAFLRKKHDLKKEEYILWKNHRMRPAALPSIRLSLFVELLIHVANVFDDIISSHKLKDVYNLFDVTAHSYWKNRSIFDREIKPRSVKMGKSFKQILFINVIIPFIYFYGETTGSEAYKRKAISWLQELPPENNKIMRLWKEEKMEIVNAADTQALYYLKKNYCDSYKCLSCQFGHLIIQDSK